jgi:hypothetical protein
VQNWDGKFGNTGKDLAFPLVNLTLRLSKDFSHKSIPMSLLMLFKSLGPELSNGFKWNINFLARLSRIQIESSNPWLSGNL